MKSIVFLLISLLLDISVSAQIRSISAKVTDATGAPVDGNFWLTDTTGKVIQNSPFNGDVAISGLNDFHLRLTLSSLISKDTTINIRYARKAEVDLGTIVTQESATALGQVTITAAAPLMHYGDNGNMEVNVAGTVLASSSSVNEILSRTPGLTINEGVISLQGKGEAIISLNGALIPAERLASISTSQIIRIEVIANPSARYDAGGRAVINIITKTPDGNGLSGRLSQHLTASDFARTNANSFADLAYGKDKFSLSANIVLLKGSGRELLYTVRNRPDSSEYLNSALMTDWKRDFNIYATYGIGVSYRFSPASVLSVSYNGNRDHLGGTVESRNRITSLTTDNNYGSSIVRNELRQNNTIMADFTKSTDTVGSQVFLSAQYSTFRTDNEDVISEFGGTEPRYLRNTFSQDLNIAALQVDHTKHFKKDVKLESGLRFSHVGNNSDTRFLISRNADGPYLPDSKLSSLFDYSESIGAAYTSFSGNIGKLSANVGVRAEWTNYKLSTTAGEGQDFGRDYLNIFPNLQLGYPLENGSKLRASYNARITRPRYQALNPFVTYQDAFTTIEGNPNLVPEKAHAFEVGINFEKTEFKIGYTYTIDPLSGAALRGNTPESYVLKSINRSSDRTFLASVTRPFSIGNWWQSINTVSVTYGRSFDDQYDYATGKVTPQAYFYTSNTFSLKQGIKLQLLAWHLGDRYYGIRHDTRRSIVTAGIEKSMLRNKLKLNLSANDIFNRSIAEGDYNVGKTQVYYNRRFGNNYFKLTATYRFGGTAAAAQQPRQVQPENSRAN
ncbi:TonB-dependent receptor [Dyadobacter chenwenxiniae]|uniref:TonB-dependent receptor n=1 Tax=Dyadobacter chenwenxiniae TaxID=2906456 RepID=A0A9X1TGK2_9BACT|nr:TonB-dependent receptor [Dyadobacter chenwenxiniae]MCF0065651.1 TonB-dependent receptor [Dyadobacter chenwenxiniae]UON85562.1 TonB-dependent receptor [Dyadobacter chenwenxiniae]